MITLRGSDPVMHGLVKQLFLAPEAQDLLMTHPNSFLPQVGRAPAIAIVITFFIHALTAGNPEWGTDAT